jgi:hypothetical protein
MRSAKSSTTMKTKHIFFALVCVLISTVSFAQVKVGDNPGTLAPNTVLHVEKGGNHMVVSTTGNVGIGTQTPTNKLEISASSDPLKMTGLQNSSGTNDILNVDATGVVKKIPVSSLISTTAVVGLLQSATEVIGTTQLTINANVTADLPGCVLTVVAGSNARLVITSSALPLPAAASAPVQGSIDLVIDGVKVTSQYYSATDAPSTLVRLGNYSTVTKVYDVTAGSHTIKLQAKSWANNTIFNVDPVSAGYVGAAATDGNAMKCKVSVQSYTR